MIFNIKYFLFVPLLLILISPRMHAQDFSTKSKKALKLYMEGQENYSVEKYGDAEILFKEAIEKDSEFIEAYLTLAQMYEELDRDTSAISYYKKALDIDADKYPSAFFYVAELEFGNGYYNDALTHYSAYITYPNINNDNKSNSLKHIADCKFAIDAIAHPVPFNPINMGVNVNTDRDEYFPCLTADNQTLLFTRLLAAPETFTGKQEDFFICYKSGDDWSAAKNIGPPINSNRNEGAPSLSVDGNTLVFTACEGLNGYENGRRGYGRCDLFVSTRNGIKWTAPYNIGQPLNSRYWESQPSLSSDGKTLYFISNRNNNYDIWVSELDENNEWSNPEMLGPNINTGGYEGSVFIHPDNQTLYFSSDGHIGMGMLDIFYSRIDSSGNWGEPINLGYPINTHKSENSILISTDGELALFASDRPEGNGGLDLYAFQLYEIARPQPVTYMKGVVFDSETKKKLQARFELIDLKTGKIVTQSYSNKGNGEFLVCLPTNSDYALNVSKNGYLFYSENFNLIGEQTLTEPEHKDIPLQPIKVGESVVLKNIFFETDKFDLKNKSRIEIDKLFELLNKNPEIRIEISGHTDNVGSEIYNVELSKNRAKAVYDYLIAKGINPDRLSYKGYGEAKPIDTNDTESGRHSNRRTEFKVVGK
jgi:outer membrane protein OmpA-like peptidoglycan-associated protein